MHLSRLPFPSTCPYLCACLHLPMTPKQVLCPVSHATSLMSKELHPNVSFHLPVSSSFPASLYLYCRICLPNCPCLQASHNRTNLIPYSCIHHLLFPVILSDHLFFIIHRHQPYMSSADCSCILLVFTYPTYSIVSMHHYLSYLYLHRTINRPLLYKTITVDIEITTPAYFKIFYHQLYSMFDLNVSSIFFCCINILKLHLYPDAFVWLLFSAIFIQNPTIDVV